MSTTINERIGQLVKGLGLTNNSFAKSINKSSSTINYIVDGKTRPGYDLLDSIFNTYPQVNPNWLLTGREEMFGADKAEFSSAGIESYLQKIEGKYENLLAEKQLVIDGLTSVIKYQQQLMGKSEGAIVEPFYLGSRKFTQLMHTYKKATMQALLMEYSLIEELVAE